MDFSKITFRDIIDFMAALAALLTAAYQWFR